MVPGNGQAPEKANSQQGLTDSPGGPAPFTDETIYPMGVAEWAIERLDLHSRGAQKIGDWISEWKKLRDEGWDVMILHERQGGDLIGFGYRKA